MPLELPSLGSSRSVAGGTTHLLHGDDDIVHAPNSLGGGQSKLFHQQSEVDTSC